MKKKRGSLCAHRGVELLELPQAKLAVLVLVKELKDDLCLLLSEGELLLQHCQSIGFLQALHKVLDVLAEDLSHIFSENKNNNKFS